MVRKVLIIMAMIGLGHPPMWAEEPGSPLLEATRNLIGLVSDELRGKLVMPFNSDERLNWHFVPRARPGVSFKDLDPGQRDAVLAVLRAGLSEQGYHKAQTIRNLEAVLREMEGRAFRDPDLYYIMVFGEPSQDGNWMVRYEGHHISFNWTFVGGKLAATSPQFLGANPAEVRLEGSMKGTRALAAEEDLARGLVKSLDDGQRAAAIVSDTAPADILTAASREAAIQEDIGIAYKNLSAEQQGVLLSIIEEVARVQLPEVAASRLARIRADGLDEIKFAWMGGVERGQGHYYRVQGKSFLIEYDNTQNNANHIHTVWRDFKGDFGRDLLKEHYAAHYDPAHPHEHNH